MSFIERHSCEVISDGISEFNLYSQHDVDNDDEGSDSILILIHANHLQVHTHLARSDVNSARIASAGAKKYALIAISIGTSFIAFIALIQIIAFTT